ncbi:MAG: transposase [Verrucomicrobiia bacterium]
MNNLGPHSRNLRLNRLKDAPAVFFITKSLWPKKPALDAEARAVVVSAFRHAVAHDRITLAAFVVMSDHWHGLFALSVNWTLPKFMHDLMSFVGAKTHSIVKRWQTAWEDGYHDTRIKSWRQFNYMRDYINQNPVRKGLAQRPEDWDAIGIRETDIICQHWPWGFEEE